MGSIILRVLYQNFLVNVRSVHSSAESLHLGTRFCPLWNWGVPLNLKRGILVMIFTSFNKNVYWICLLDHPNWTHYSLHMWPVIFSKFPSRTSLMCKSLSQSISIIRMYLTTSKIWSHESLQFLYFTCWFFIVCSVHCTAHVGLRAYIGRMSQTVYHNNKPCRSHQARSGKHETNLLITDSTRSLGQRVR